ncbi:MAG TPA: hypothetical protein VF104_07445 [Burkholderiales bacterium]
MKHVTIALISSVLIISALVLAVGPTKAASWLLSPLEDYAQRHLVLHMFPPVVTKLLLTGSTTSAQSHTAVIDTLGYDRVTIGVAESSVAETTGHITFKIGEGDTTSAFTDVATALHGSAGAATNTSVPNTYNVNVDTRHRKRYLLLTVTPFTTKTLTSWVCLARPALSPATDAAAGVRARADA